MKYLLVLLTAAFAGLLPTKEKPIRFLIGTTDKSADSSGVYFASLNPATGEVSIEGLTKTAPGPGYIAFSPDKKGLFVVTGDHTISSYRVAEGKLTKVSTQPAEGNNPCHVSVLPSGKMAFLANYGDGSFSAYRVGNGLELTAAVFKDRYEGSGPNERRQEKAHAHCAVVSPNGRYVYVADLGTDKVMNYRVDGASGRVEVNPAQSAFSVKKGAGPRHLVLHPEGKFLYLLNELDATVTAASVDQNGVISLIDTYTTLPEDYKEPGNTSAAIRLHPNGRFLYVSNRGYDAIHGFRIEADGKLKKVTESRDKISVPRDFNLDPSGKFLVVGNSKTNNLTILSVDPKSGALSHLSTTASVPSPSCIAFF